MKSVVMKSANREVGAELVDLPEPRLGPGDLLVEMKACGLCGTDIEKMLGHYTAAMPVLGHEAVGVVSGVGSGVNGLKGGDRVFPHHHVPCGVCFFCVSGSETMCKEYRGSNIDPGGFSDLFRVPAWNVRHGGVLKLPKEVGFETASLIEPLACCVRAQERSKVKAGESALVVGAGPVGMLHAFLLNAKGVDVTISDVSKSRLDFARRKEVHQVLDATRDDVPAMVRKSTGGRGADLVVAASGNQKAIVQALRSVRRGGRVCLFGLPPKGTVLDYDISEVFNSEVSVITSYGATEKETKMALAAISKNLPLYGSLVTDTYPLERFDEAVKKASGANGMKVVLTPSGSSHA